MCIKRLRSIIPAIDIGDREYIGGFSGSSIAAFMAAAPGPLIVVAPDEEAARILYNDILFYSIFTGGTCTALLPHAGDVYQTGMRIRVLHSLDVIHRIVSYPEALLAGGWNRQEVEQHTVRLRRGQAIERETLADMCRRLGYREVPLVAQRGDMSVRNWIIDIFPSTSEFPLRVEFFGDEIDSMRSFRIDTQRSVERVESFTLYPARLQDVEDGKPLLDDICPGRRVFDIEGSLERNGWKGAATVLSFIEDGSTGGVFLPLAGKGILYDERNSMDELPAVLRRMNGCILIVMPRSYQARRLSDLFREHDLFVPVLAHDSLETCSERIVITTGSLSEGLAMNGLTILTQKEILGRRLVLDRKVDLGGERFLETIEDIEPGDFVVHRDHGIGRYRGLKRYSVEGKGVDVAEIEYAEGAMLYVPLYNIGSIDRYRAGEGAVPVLDRLGGRTWERKKKRVGKRLDLMVEKLMELYAERETMKGFAFSPDTEIHREFYSFFPYEETQDQLRALGEIFRDMESPAVMDRLLCGDVGFGKTEVAMRAAFKAVFDGRQVAVIVPTTVLCEQHYLTFRERFSPFPVTVDFISRFRTPAQNRRTAERVGRGEVDILIATHSVLVRKMKFRNLGLLIIDEEHRFGVAQKERIKELKKGVDCLMLSATPIPRTLQMALSGIRKMSVIESPPEERLAVRTRVIRYDRDIISDAIVKELAREGQVYFVHNRIEDIEKVGGDIARMVPEARIRIAHGRMRASDLEKIMVGFMRHEFDLLLCTSIIGSGIDIPRANTLIVNMADRFGLADLYQLKGRVGRGSVKAYAYFVVSRGGEITSGGRKRLRAIEALSYLGAGLKLAMKDLEIRGAGTLFGYRQYGYIGDVGFDVYTEMLKEAVARRSGSQVDEEGPVPELDLDLDLDAGIPRQYVEDDSIRLGLYRRLSMVDSEDELAEFREELEDRFGTVPPETEVILDAVSLRIGARGTGATGITIRKDRAVVTFGEMRGEVMERFFSLAEHYTLIRYLEDGFECGFGEREEWSERVGKLADIFDYLSGSGE